MVKPREQVWYDDKQQHIVLDLSSVRTREELIATMQALFPGNDLNKDVWQGIRHTIVEQSCPVRLDLVGWSSFYKRMPRYARRLMQLLHQYRQWHPHALHVEIVE